MASLVETTAPQGVANNMVSAWVVVASAAPILRLGVKQRLAACEPSWRPVEADSFAAALDLVHAGRCDLLLIDADLMPSSGGGPRPWQGASDGPRVIILGERTNRTRILRWLDAGARGYLPRSADPALLDCAIRTVLLGGVFMPPFAADPMPRTVEAERERPCEPALTARQQQVFELLLQGLSTKQIARRLDLAVATVSIQLAAAFRALAARSGSEFVINGLCRKPPDMASNPIREIRTVWRG